MIALCCHHRCEWHHFLGKKYMVEAFKLESINEFQTLCGLTSWATCGTGKPRDSAVNSQNDSGAAQGRYDRLGLDKQRREALGRKVKRILDFARCQFVRENCGLDDVGLSYYCKPDLTLENVVLLGKCTSGTLS